MIEQIQQIQLIQLIQQQTTVSAGGRPTHVLRVPHLMGLRTSPGHDGHDSRGDRRKVRLTRLTPLAR